MILAMLYVGVVFTLATISFVENPNLWNKFWNGKREA